MVSQTPVLETFNKNKALKWPGNHVFFIKADEYFEKINGQFEDVLTVEELKKADSFFRTADRKNYIVRKYVLRNLLSVLLGKEAQSIQFGTIANKKPYIKDIPFNVSHSANVVTIALSGRDVGIDIELIKDGFSYQNISDECFNSAEQLMIQKQEHSPGSFYTLWTRKEAILKACGKGLYDDLKSLNVLFPRVKYSAQSYRVLSAIVLESYMMSIALNFEEEKIYYWTL